MQSPELCKTTFRFREVIQLIFLKKSQQVDYQEIIDSLNMRTETNTEKRKMETELLKNNKYVLFIKNN